MVRELDDESFLDEVFELASERLAAGEAVSAEEFIAARPHLRLEILEAVRISEELAVRPRERPLPSVEGYETLRELGRGAMGAVYLARQLALDGRQVALKVLPAPLASSPRQRARFHSEVRALARLRHPNVVRIHDVVEQGEVLAYAMDWIEGSTLAEVIDRMDARDRGALAEVIAAARDRARFCAKVGAEIARALDEAHRSGLLHRDVKPSNVLIRADGTALLSDFGLVRAEESSLHTRTGDFVGTLAYSAPEQLEGRREEIDARADVYSLGATLYHAATGRLPFPGRSPAEILLRVREGFCEPIRSLDRRLPRDLETIVSKAMVSDRERRYASAAALAEDLERFLKGRPIRARRASAAYQFQKLVQRHRAPFALLSLLLLALAAFGAAMAWLSVRLSDQAQEISAQSREIETERDKALAAEDQALEDAERARVQAAKAERVADFVLGMFAAVNPEEGGHDVRVSEILDAAAERLELALAEEREVAVVVRLLLGRGYLASGEYERAEELLARCVSDFRELGPGGENGLISALIGLGEARILLDRSGSAGAPLAEALELAERLHGERSYRAAECRSTLAGFHLSEGRLAEAESGFRLALSIEEELGAPADPVLATTLQNLASVLSALGRPEEAQPLFERALESRLAAVGPDHLGAAQIKWNLAGLLAQRGEVDAAEKLFREALETCRAKLGPDHPRVAEMLLNLAWLLGQRGVPAEGEPLAREGLEILEARLGPEHRDVARALSVLASLLRGLERSREAVEVGSEAVAGFRELQPECAGELAGALVQLASAHLSLGELDESRARLEEALAIQRVVHPPGHLELASTQFQLARIHSETGAPAAAVPLLEETLAIWRRWLGERAGWVVAAEVALGGALAATDRQAEAEALLLGALEKAPADEHAPMPQATVLRALAGFYEAWGKPEEAERYRARLR